MPCYPAGDWSAHKPEKPMIQLILGGIAGAVAAVAIPRVYAAIAAKIAALKAKV